jgi:uncharacterized membrane protein
MKPPLWYLTTMIFAVAATIIVFVIHDTDTSFELLRATFGLIFIFFLPGYCIIKALYPKNFSGKEGTENLDNTERWALSVGASLVLTTIVGIILNYTPYGITLTSVTLSLLSLTFTISSIEVLREILQQKKYQKAGLLNILLFKCSYRSRLIKKTIKPLRTASSSIGKSNVNKLQQTTQKKHQRK